MYTLNGYKTGVIALPSMAIVQITESSEIKRECDKFITFTIVKRYIYYVPKSIP